MADVFVAEQQRVNLHWYAFIACNPNFFTIFNGIFLYKKEGIALPLIIIRIVVDIVVMIVIIITKELTLICMTIVKEKEKKKRNNNMLHCIHIVP